MGIRVHKVLGYGTQKASKFIDQEKLSEIEEDLCGATLRKLKGLLKKNGDTFEALFVDAEGYKVKDGVEDLNFLVSTGKAFDFYEHLKYDSEDFDEGIVLLPFLCRDWQRYDDSIDYIEEHNADGPVTRFVTLKRRCGIYPYVGMTRFRNPNGIVLPEELTYGLMRNGAMSPSDYSQSVGWWDPKRKPLAKGDVLKHLLEDYRPRLPLSIGTIITLIAKSMKGDPREFLNLLRPCIYVYWC